MLADFHFLRPFWLLALIPALLLIILLRFYRQQQSPWHQLIAPHLQHFLLNGQRIIKQQPLALPALLLAWLLGVVALAGPSWQKLPQPSFALKKATVLVLDMSLSMRATDMTPDRATQLRFKAMDFVRQLGEGELALISFAGDAFVISPLTPDHNNIRLLLPDLRPEIMPVQGSDLLTALQQADQLLQQAGYPRGDVVVFTDGFEPRSYTQIMDYLNNWPHRLSVLAFGTEQGAVVRLENGELLKNQQGAVVLPRVPLTQLAALAGKSGGVFSPALVSDQDLQLLLKQPALSPLTDANELQQIKGDQWQDNAIYLVWLLLPLILWLGKKTALLLMLTVFIYIPDAAAFSWKDLWKTPQQQAVDDYQQQQFDAAQQKFTDPFWQGNAAYRSNDYIAAEQAFRQAASRYDNAESFHNLGNALAQQQRFAEALEAYQQALSRQPDNTAAQQNADLMQRLLQQQEQQQSGENNNSSDSEQQSGDNTESADNGENSQNEGQDQQNESPSADETESASDNENSNSPQNTEQNTTPEQPEMTEQQTEQAATEQQDNQTQQAVQETWPNATAEEQQELNNLLRKVQDDPALLLRNKMYLEYQKRQYQTPRGNEQTW